MKEQRTIASRRLSIGAVLVTVLLAVSADVASAASSSPPRTAVTVYAPHTGSPDARPAFVPFAANTPHLGTRDRLLVQGLGALSLTLTLALALQSRVLDAKDEGSVPRWVHRCVPVVDVVVTAALATIGVAIVYASLWALSHDPPLDDRDRTFLKWLETLVGVLAFWVILVGVSRGEHFPCFGGGIGAGHGTWSSTGLSRPGHSSGHCSASASGTP